MGVAEFLALLHQELFEPQGQQEQPGEDGETHEDEFDVFHEMTSSKKRFPKPCSLRNPWSVMIES